MRCIIVDTSSIMFGVEKRADVFQRLREKYRGCTIVLPNGVLAELRKVARSRRVNRKYAAVALKIIDKHNPEIVPSGPYVDRWLLRKAPPMKCIVCTNDTQLKRRLKLKGVRTVGLAMGGVIR